MGKRKQTVKRWINTEVVSRWNPLSGRYETLSKEGFWYDGPLALATTPPFYEVTDWAFYADGTESGSVIIGTKNTNPAAGLDTDTIYQFRSGVHETSGNLGKNTVAQLQYNHNSGGWNNVTASSSVVQVVASADLTDGEDTTQRMTAFSYDATNDGVDEVDGIAGGDFADFISNGAEMLFSIQIIGADVTDADTIQLKVVNSNDGDADFNAYNQTDTSFTVNKAAGSLEVTATTDAITAVKVDSVTSRSTGVTTTTDSLVTASVATDVSRATDIIATSGAVGLAEVNSVLTRETLAVATSATAILQAVDTTVTYPFGDLDFEASTDMVSLTEVDAVVARETFAVVTIDDVSVSSIDSTVKFPLNIDVSVDTVSLTGVDASVSSPLNLTVTTARIYVGVKPVLELKSFVLDAANNWGSTYAMALRQIDFYLGPVKIELSESEYTDFSSSEFDPVFNAGNVFSTSYLKTGGQVGVAWISANKLTNQRIGFRLDIPNIRFNKVVVNNSHNEGVLTDRGIKDVAFYMTEADYTNNVFEAAVTGGTKLFDGQFSEHPAVDTSDDVEYELLTEIKPIVNREASVTATTDTLVVTGVDSEVEFAPPLSVTATTDTLVVTGVGADVAFPLTLAATTDTVAVTGVDAGVASPLSLAATTARIYVGVKPVLELKSFILDIDNNWGDVSNVALRQIDFYLGAEKVELRESDFTDFSSSHLFDDIYNAGRAFDTSYPKDGKLIYREWVSETPLVTNQRIGFRLDIPNIRFNKVVVNNSHHFGGFTSRGVKDAAFHMTLADYTNNVFEDVVTGGTKLFDGRFSEHPGVDTSDDVEYDLLTNLKPIVNLGLEVVAATDTLVVTGVDVGVVFPLNLTVTTTNVTLAPIGAVVSFNFRLRVYPGTDSMSLSSGDVVVSRETIVTVTVGGVSATEIDPLVAFPLNITTSGVRLIKSVVLDFADNHGDPDYMGVRSIEFLLIDGSTITMNTTLGAFYSTTDAGGAYLPWRAFDTSLFKTGLSIGNAWASAEGGTTNQRLIIVFNSPKPIAGVRVNNYHSSGSFTPYGVNNTQIYVSPEEVTDTVYGNSVPNGIEIFDGIIARHEGSDTVDDQDLNISLPPALMSLDPLSVEVSRDTSAVVTEYSVSVSAIQPIIYLGYWYRRSHAVDEWDKETVESDNWSKESLDTDSWTKIGAE